MSIENRIAELQRIMNSVDSQTDMMTGRSGLRQQQAQRELMQLLAEQNIQRTQAEQAARDAAARTPQQPARPTAAQQRSTLLDSTYNRLRGSLAGDLQRYHGVQADDELNRRFSPFIREQLESMFTQPGAGATEYVAPTGIDSRYLDSLGQFVNREQGAWRRQQGQPLDTMFRSGFERDALADTADDDIIERILGDQSVDADRQIQGAFDRGQLNQAGFDFAQENMRNARTAARTRLSGIGSDILSTKRRDLTGLRDRAFQDRDALRYGQTLGDYGSILDNMLRERRGNLEGAVRGAVGNERFFNPNELIQRAGGMQGATNVRFAQGMLPRGLMPPGYQGVDDDDDDDADNQRSVRESSNVGTF